MNRGIILSLDYFYKNVNMYVLNKVLLSLNNLNINVAGIKASYSDIILDIKYSTNLSIIGCRNMIYPDSIANITPTINEIYELNKAGANIIYLDASTKIRSKFTTIHEFYYEIKSIFPEIYFIGEVSTLEDIKNIASLDFDAICIKENFDLINECSPYIKSYVPIMFDSIYGNNFVNYEKYLNMGFDNVIVNSKFITPQYMVSEFIEKIFN